MKRFYESGIDTTGSDEVDSYFYIECEYDSDCDLEICDKKVSKEQSTMFVT